MESFKIFWISLRKQTKDFARYPNYFLKSFFYTPILYVLPIYYLMKAGTPLADKDFVFKMILCVIIWQYIEFSLIETCNISNRELNIGTIEVIYSLPISRVAWILGSSCVASILFAVSNFGIIILCLCIFKPVIDLQLLYALVITITVFIQTCVCCVVVFVLNIRYKKIFNTLLILSNLLYIFSGVVYPIEELPPLCQSISRFLPFTHVFKIIRGEEMLKKDLYWYLWVNIFYIVVSLVLYIKIEKGMKKDGSLSNY